VTLATLVVTHHSSMPARAPDPLAAVETADRASTARSAWALRDDEADEEEMHRELEKLDGDLARVKKDAAEVAGVGLDDDAYEPRAPKRRAERVAHRSPFESESEEAPADVDDDRARKTAKRAHHRTASASGSESSLDLDLSDEALEDFAFDTADAMDLEEYAGLARARRVKLERFEDVLADEAQMRELLRRAVAKVARGEAVRPVAPGDISRALGFEISSSLAEKRREQILAEARQSLSAADASVGKAEDSEAEDSESPKDAGFEDATWAEDDYRASATSTKDPNAMNRLDPVVSAPGAPSEKTDDETMAKLLKHVEENKATIAEQVIRDDGELDEDAFIQELVREGAIVAPEDEPERARKTSAGNYLDGAFDGDDLKRIVNDEDVRTLDERVNEFPELAEADVEDNARDEIPEAFVSQDVDAMEDAFDNLKETLASRYEEDDMEAPAPEEMEAEGPAEAEEPEAAPAPAETEAEGPSEAAEAPTSGETEAEGPVEAEEAPEDAPEPAAAEEAEGPAEAEEAEEAAAPAEAEDAEEEEAAAPGPAEPIL
jgi:hypothetical protein